MRVRDKRGTGLLILWKSFTMGWRQSQMHTRSDAKLMATANDANSKPIAGDTT